MTAATSTLTTDLIEKVADHGARIKTLEETQKENGRKLDRIQFFILTTLVAILVEIYRHW